MGFTELTFLFIFLPATVISYLLLERLFHNDRINNLLVVFQGLLFYYWANKEALFAFIEIVIFTYMAGCMVSERGEYNRDDRKKKLAFAVTILIGALAYYKYIGIVADLVNTKAGMKLISIESLIVPIGLSFVIFESVSYVVDIYRGEAPVGSFLDCVTFLSLFQKLVSGPIVLWKDFSPQLRDRRVPET